jgi:hypothetical protein
VHTRPFSAVWYLAGFAGWLTGVAHADDAAGLYVGAAGGRADLRSSAANPEGGAFDRFSTTATAWQLILGTRPVRSFGAELTYMSLGDAGSTNSSSPTLGINETSQRAVSASGLAYLSENLFDLYVRLGLTRLHTEFTQTSWTGSATCAIGQTCSNFAFQHLDRWNTDLSYGAGLQAHIGPMAIRLEYVNIVAPGGHPDFLGLGVTWTL